MSQWELEIENLNVAEILPQNKQPSRDVGEQNLSGLSHKACRIKKYPAKRPPFIKKEDDHLVCTLGLGTSRLPSEVASGNVRHLLSLMKEEYFLTRDCVL